MPGMLGQAAFDPDRIMLFNPSSPIDRRWTFWSQSLRCGGQTAAVRAHRHRPVRESDVNAGKIGYDAELVLTDILGSAANRPGIPASLLNTSKPLVRETIPEIERLLQILPRVTHIRKHRNI